MFQRVMTTHIDALSLVFLFLSFFLPTMEATGIAVFVKTYISILQPVKELYIIPYSRKQNNLWQDNALQIVQGIVDLYGSGCQI